MVPYKGNMQNFAVCVTSNSRSESGVLFRNFGFDDQSATMKKIGLHI